jgi:hypothetical protein
MDTYLVHTPGEGLAFHQGIMLIEFDGVENSFSTLAVGPADGYRAATLVQDRKIDLQVIESF